MSTPIVPQNFIDAELEKAIEVEKALAEFRETDTGDTDFPVQYYTEQEKEDARRTEFTRLAWHSLKRAKNETGSQVMRSDPPRLLMSAGGPGAWKSTLLRDIATTDPKFAHAVIVSPDEDVLEKLQGYNAYLADHGRDPEARIAAYTYYRWMSVYIDHLMTNKVADLGLDMIKDITATGPAMIHFYQGMRRAGYGDITTEICVAPEDVRLASVDKRFFEDGARYTPMSDVLKKGNEEFPERIPLYFEQSDSVRMHYVDGEQRILAAHAKNGTVEILDQNAFDLCMAEIQMRNPDFKWDQVVQIYETAPKGIEAVGRAQVKMQEAKMQEHKTPKAKPQIKPA